MNVIMMEQQNIPINKRLLAAEITQVRKYNYSMNISMLCVIKHLELFFGGCTRTQKNCYPRNIS